MAPRSTVGDHFRMKPYYLCDRRLRRPAPLVAHHQSHDQAGERCRGENAIQRRHVVRHCPHPVSNNRSKFKHPFKKDASRQQGMTDNFHHTAVF
jgi:hypothetical protein